MGRRGERRQKLPNGDARKREKGSAGFLLQTKFISNEGDKFGVCGFAFVFADSIAKETINKVYFATAPGYFNGMADRPFHSAGGSVAFFRNGRVELLCDIIQHIHIINGHNNGFPHVVVASNMGRYTNVMEDSSYFCF